MFGNWIEYFRIWFHQRLIASKIFVYIGRNWPYLLCPTLVDIGRIQIGVTIFLRYDHGFHFGHELIISQFLDLIQNQRESSVSFFGFFWKIQTFSSKNEDVGIFSLLTITLILFIDTWICSVFARDSFTDARFIRILYNEPKWVHTITWILV